MANFHTHVNGGILVSGTAVLGLHEAGLVEPIASLPYFALGVAGSLLPDIDADDSKPVRAFFNVLGVALAFAMTLPLTARFRALDLVLIWVGVYVGVRLLIFELFARLTVHRGIWHSWVAMVAVSLGTVNIAYWLLDQPRASAWLAGLMVGIGYLTHLCLDELYSVDLLNTRVKRSFGTALKPFSVSDPVSSLAMVAAGVLLAWLAPGFDATAFPLDAVGGVLAGIGASLQAALRDLLEWSGPLARALGDRLGSARP